MRAENLRPLYALADENKINNMLAETERNREMCNQIVRRVFIDPTQTNSRPVGPSVSIQGVDYFMFMDSTRTFSRPVDLSVSIFRVLSILCSWIPVKHKVALLVPQ